MKRLAGRGFMAQIVKLGNAKGILTGSSMVTFEILVIAVVTACLLIWSSLMLTDWKLQS